MTAPQLRQSQATLLVALAALLAPLLAVTSAMALAPLIVMLGVASLAFTWRNGMLARLPWGVLVPLAPVCAWAALTLLWTPEPGHAAQSLLRVLAITVCGITTVGMAGQVPAAERQVVLRWLTVGIGIALLTLGSEYATDNALSALVNRAKGLQPLPEGAKSQMNRGASVVILLVWPLVLLATRLRRPLWCAGAFAAVAAVTLLGDSLAARVGLAAGGAVFLAAGAAPRGTFHALRIALVVVVMALPAVVRAMPTPPQSFAALPWLPPSAQHRLVIWGFAAERIAEKPLSGWGMDASRVVPGGDQPFRHEWQRPEGAALVMGEMIPLHPHSAVLQWWLELGGVGALLAGAFLWWVVGRVERVADRWARAAGAAALTAGAMVALVGYGIWQNWWLGALWLTAALWTLAARPDEPASGALA